MVYSGRALDRFSKNGGALDRSSKNGRALDMSSKNGGALDKTIAPRLDELLQKGSKEQPETLMHNHEPHLTLADLKVQVQCPTTFGPDCLDPLPWICYRITEFRTHLQVRPRIT